MAMPSGYTVPSTLSIRNNQKVRAVTTVLLTGGNVTPATTTGYAWITITSGLWTSSSPWTQLAALYQFVRPLGCRVSVTFNRATGNTDNPRMSFVPTPAGTPVGSLGMSLSTLESPSGRSFVGGPGQTLTGNFDPYISIAAFNTVANGYQVSKPGYLNLNSLPLVYYGDILFFTPSINLSTVTAYVTIKIEFIHEFFLLDPANTQ